jgi:hypothetical protein
MTQEISVSKEYIDTVCDWLETWADQEDSWAVPQFLKKYGIGWTYFQGMMDICPQLHHTFEVIVAGLCSKWLLYAMEKGKDLPKHMQQVLMKYLRVYDNHAYFVDQEAKKEVARNTQFSVINYAVEDYSKERLEGLHKSRYSEQSNKRRNRKQA